MTFGKSPCPAHSHLRLRLPALPRLHPGAASRSELADRDRSPQDWNGLPDHAAKRVVGAPFALAPWPGRPVFVTAPRS
jgi:hypothetical protein